MLPEKKPEESAFVQQTLPDWRPEINAGRVAPLLLAIGVLFIPIGVLVIYLSSDMQEKIVDYTYCKPINSSPFGNETCADVIGYFRNKTCNCRVNFSLDEPIRGTVNIYYALTNFYQNHQKYVKSRDDVQLLGKLSKDVSSNCRPYAYLIENGTSNTIAPCGAIANSMFNDQLTLTFNRENSHESLPVPLLRTGLAWPSDKTTKFRNPPGNLEEAFKEYAKPIDWQKNIWELDPAIPGNNGFQNEDFIVWMRTAALPNFRKLYRRVNHSSNLFSSGLPRGNYVLNVVYSYPVVSFGGTKSLVINNASTLVFKNSFIGVAYTVVGFILIMFSVALRLIDRKYGKKLN